MVMFVQHTLLRLSCINTLDVYVVSDMLAHPISNYRCLDNCSFQMSNRFFERLWVNAISSSSHSDASCDAKSNNKVSTDLGVVKTNKG